jgi:hypothetical protein
MLDGLAPVSHLVTTIEEGFEERRRMMEEQQTVTARDAGVASSAAAGSASFQNTSNCRLTELLSTSQSFKITARKIKKADFCLWYHTSLSENDAIGCGVNA